MCVESPPVPDAHGLPAHRPTRLTLDYLVLSTVERPEKFPLVALRWHGRFELEARTLTLAESQLALSALVAMGEGDADAVGVLARMLRKVQPTLLSRVS